MSSGILPNLQAFIEKLRKFERNSLVESERNAIWESFRSHMGNPSSTSRYEYQMMQVYGSCVIILALAAANNQRKLKATAGEFRKLCALYGMIVSYMNIARKIENSTAMPLAV